MNSLDLYIITSLKCETWNSLSSSSNDNIIETLKYTEYLSLCNDNADECSNESGSFQWSYNYTIPSSPATYSYDNNNEAGYNISTELLFYTAEDKDTIVGDCKITFASTTDDKWFYKYYSKFNKYEENDNVLVDDNSIKLWYTHIALFVCLTVLIVAAGLIISSSLPSRQCVDNEIFSYELS